MGKGDEQDSNNLLAASLTSHSYLGHKTVLLFRLHISRNECFYVRNGNTNFKFKFFSRVQTRGGFQIFISLSLHVVVHAHFFGWIFEPTIMKFRIYRILDVPVTSFETTPRPCGHSSYLSQKMIINKQISLTKNLQISIKGFFNFFKRLSLPALRAYIAALYCVLVYRTSPLF